MKEKEQEKQWQLWMAQAQTGDENAYKQLLAGIYPIIQRFLLSKFGPLGTSEDMTQECLIAIHKARHTYDPKRPFQPWMFAVVRYKSIDLLRKKQKQWQREISDDEYVATYSVSDTNTQIEGEREMVREALDGLPEEMKRAVVLTKIDGLNTKEAAHKEGVSQVALRSRVSRAYKVLRKKMERELAK